MQKKKILFVAQEISPFITTSTIANTMGRLPQVTQESGRDIRIFAPRFGCINERRHQLHEVIRLSGLNLVIDEADHPLVIKVASVPQVKIQVYFIENEDFFDRASLLKDEEGKEFTDNDERAMFFGRGVLETVKKLGWKPDIIHCHGWIAALTPLYVKKRYHTDPHFANAKVIYSVYEEGFEQAWSNDFRRKLLLEGFKKDAVEGLEDIDFTRLNEMAISISDGVIQGSQHLDPPLKAAIEGVDVPVLDYCSEASCAKRIDAFYDQVVGELIENQ